MRGVSSTSSTAMVHEKAARLRTLIIPLAATVLMVSTCTPNDASSVFFIEPIEGTVVSSPVDVAMGADGFTIEPAEEGVGENRGHFHIMVDAPCVQARLTVGEDERHLHFGGGQSTARLDLTPGDHTLCLQAGDASHTALGIVDVITITVEE